VRVALYRVFAVLCMSLLSVYNTTRKYHMALPVLPFVYMDGKLDVSL
jgi:hypothetical protein